jgi:soluble lytic murein transglycosylase-like protein
MLQWAWACAVLAVVLSPLAPARAGPDKEPARPTVDEICRTLAEAAADNDLPEEFFTRLIWQESRFDPSAVSPAGAQGIAQFMPGTARAYGLRNPFDAGAAIDAQAHLMHDLLRRFAAVPLALAAYNAGAAPVAACMCVPPIPETAAYVASILGLLGGAGDAMGMSGLSVRLVR